MALSPKKAQATHETLIKQYQRWEGQADKWRPVWRKWRRYHDGDQWDTEAQRVLRQRNEPIVTDNVVVDKVNSLLGVEIQSRTDIRALPRNPGSADQQTADAATDALRFVADNVELNQRFSEAAEYEFIEHTGALEAYLRDAETGEIGVKRLHTWQIYWDPTSVELDFSDAGWQGVQVLLDEAVVKARYPGRKNANAISRAYLAQEDGYTPKNIVWADREKHLVRVFQTYWKDPASGETMHATWTLGGFLEPEDMDSPDVSIYKDDRGRTVNPYIWQSAAIDRDGLRYGIVKRMIDLQDEINKRRSKGLHYLNSNQFHYESDAVEDPDHAANEGRKPDGKIEYRPGALVAGAARFDKNVELAAGNLQLLQDTRQQLAGTGPADALAGRGGQSGRHLQTQQRGELIAISPILDRHQSLKRRTYRALWMRIKQFWTDSRWIRVRDTDKGFKFTPLNVPTTELDDEMAAAFGIDQMVMQNRESEMPEMVNAVKDMDFDIVLEDVPDVATVAEEQEARLVRLAELGVVFPRDVYLEMMQFPNKRRLQDAVENSEQQNQEAMQQQQQVALQQLQMAMERQQAEIDKLKSEAAENYAEAAKDTAEVEAGRLRLLMGE